MILAANPGVASRKYALFKGNDCLLKIHFYINGNKITVSYFNGKERKTQPAPIANIAFACSLLGQIFDQAILAVDPEQISTIGLRVVAPSKHFQDDRILEKRVIAELQKLEPKAKNDINSVIQEFNLLKRYFPKAEIIGVSDTAFHIRHSLSGKYGYFGLSVESVVNDLKKHHYLPGKLIVCNLDYYTNVTAVLNGKSIDTTDNHSWRDGAQAQIPSRQFIFQIRKSIGGMAASLGGIDSLVFTGTVGERQPGMRKKVASNFGFLGAALDDDRNNNTVEPAKITLISADKAAAKIYVVPVDETKTIAQHAAKF